MPLSRSISRTASMISWLISHPLVDQVAPHDRLVRNVHVGAVDADAQLVRARLGHLTLEPERPASGSAVRSETVRPTTPAKCCGLRSGRAVPGEETSAGYSRG